MSTLNSTGAKKDQDEGPHQGAMVPITIDGNERMVHRGSTAVAELKRLGSVPLAYELEQVVNGTLQPLADDGKVTLKGGEQFVGHPRGSASS